MTSSKDGANKDGARKDEARKDEARKDEANKHEGRTRQAKGSVQEAIGKIIGNAAVETHGLSESKAGARQAKAERPIDPPADKDGED